jgi:hypothetical protein
VFESFFGSCMNKENWKYERGGGREQNIFICDVNSEEELFASDYDLATCFFPFLPFFIVTQHLSFALAAMIPFFFLRYLKFQS